MSCDYLPGDLQQLWQELCVNPIPVPLDQLRAEAANLERGLVRRLVVGGGAALLVAVVFAAFFPVFPEISERIGALLTVVGAGYLAGQILLRHSRMTPDAAGTECLRFYREELERQRDFHRGAWLWSRIAFILPGPLAFIVGLGQEYPKLAPLVWLHFATIPGALTFGAVLNLKLARKYQRRIDALDRSLSGE